jgi:hypothetical protein
MAAPIYVGQSDLETFFPPNHVRQVFCDDGTGTPGPRLAVACSVGCRQADGFLLKAWADDNLAALVAGDDAIRLAVCQLVMAVGVLGKPEWSGEGAPYASSKKDALATLQLLSTAQLRSRAEKTGGGANPNAKGSIASAACPQFVFAPSRRNPRPGGY